MPDEIDTPEAPAEPKPSLEDVLARMEQANQQLSRAAVALESARTPTASVLPPLPIPDPFEGVDPATLSGDQLRKYIETKAEAKAKAATEAVYKKLEQLEQAQVRQYQERINAEIAEVRQKHPDFDKYSKTIYELSREHPTLTVKQLYKLAREEAPAKQEKPAAKPAPAPSEKPTHSAARPPINVTRETPLPQGRRGIRQAILDYQNRK